MLTAIEKELARFLESLPPPDPRLPIDIARAVHHIHGRLFHPDLNVATLRQACGLKSNAFHGRFRAFVGLTPKCYLVELRLEAAKQILRSLPDASVAPIAGLVGYDHPETFFRFFRRITGMSPAEWRNAQYELAGGGDESADPSGGLVGR